MNNTRRKALTQISERITEIKDLLEEIQQDESDCFDNLPEGIQQSERGEAIEVAAENLESAVSSLDECLDLISTAINGE